MGIFAFTISAIIHFAVPSPILQTMQYLEFTFETQPATEAIHDILADVLATVGFDSFVHSDELESHAVTHAPDPEHPDFLPQAGDGTFKAYIPKAAYDPDTLDAALADFPLPGVTVHYTMAEAEDKDWNEEWERNYFQPLCVDGRCVIAGTFHQDVPDAEYRIFINPQMSFGTGHHATTSQMISRLLSEDLTGREVLDMGCGTGILALLARLRGARHCLGIDVDEWCVKNSRDNIALNHFADGRPIDGIDIELGDASSLAGRGPFDLILANINLGILLRDLPAYIPCLRIGGEIFLSGFYDTDIPQLVTAAEAFGLTLVDRHVLDGWACLKMRRDPS